METAGANAVEGLSASWFAFRSQWACSQAFACCLETGLFSS